jgi:hypothetical protein
VDAAAGAEVDDPVAARHEVELVLDDDDPVAALHQAAQRAVEEAMSERWRPVVGSSKSSRRGASRFGRRGSWPA